MPQVTTSDGVRLSYLERGSGPPLVMIPGWSNAAVEFKHQLDGLSDRNRVIAIDMRGHGESEKPAHGYKIQRLAKDVWDVLRALDLTDVALAGHSMGCSIIWCYLDLFGNARLGKLVLIDQMPFMTSNPLWTQQDRDEAGSGYDGKTLYDRINAVAGPDGVSITQGLVRSMFTKTFPPSELAWVAEQILKMPRHHAATLFYNHSTQDWRDLIPRIDLPTLIFGARTGPVGWKSQEWVQRQIKGSRLEIFEEDEGGNHFMFLENPAKFNRIVREFLG